MPMRTCEFVSPKHPDKLCDFIADSILDAYLAGDNKSRVAIELLGGHGKDFVSGEVTSTANVDIKETVAKIVGEDYEIVSNVSKQSPEIARGVDTGGAGDQGIMMGYATSETETFMPKEYDLARSLCQDVYKEYPFDGKTQVTIEDGKVSAVVASFQNTKTKELEDLVRSLIRSDLYLINPAGDRSPEKTRPRLTGARLICAGGSPSTFSRITTPNRSGPNWRTPSE